MHSIVQRSAVLGLGMGLGGGQVGGRGVAISKPGVSQSRIFVGLILLILEMHISWWMLWTFVALCSRRKGGGVGAGGWRAGSH